MFQLFDWISSHASRASPTLCALPDRSCRLNKLVTLAGIVICSAMLAGCVTGATTSLDPRYPEIYLRKVDKHHNGLMQHPDQNSESGVTEGQPRELESDPLNQQGLRRRFADFIDLFANLQPENLESKIKRVYAEQIYFNDTLQTHTSRKSLTEYLMETAQRVDYSRVNIVRIIPSGNDYFMIWNMRIGFQALGKTIKSESIGMTHVRLDAEGKVNFHQDFWDNTEGLFRHLPVVGYLISKIKDRL